MKILVIPRGLTLLEKWGFLCLITRVCPWKINVWVCTFLGWRLCCHTTAAEVHLLHPAQGLRYMAAQPGPHTPSRCRGSQPQSRSHSPHPRWAMQPVQDWHCHYSPAVFLSRIKSSWRNSPAVRKSLLLTELTLINSVRIFPQEGDLLMTTVVLPD